MLAKMAMIVMTTSSSMSVKAETFFFMIGEQNAPRVCLAGKVVKPENLNGDSLKG